MFFLLLLLLAMSTPAEKIADVWTNSWSSWASREGAALILLKNIRIGASGRPLLTYHDIDSNAHVLDAVTAEFPDRVPPAKVLRTALDLFARRRPVGPDEPQRPAWLAQQAVMIRCMISALRRLARRSKQSRSTKLSQLKEQLAKQHTNTSMDYPSSGSDSESESSSSSSGDVEPRDKPKCFDQADTVPWDPRSPSMQPSIITAGLAPPVPTRKPSTTTQPSSQVPCEAPCVADCVEISDEDSDPDMKKAVKALGKSPSAPAVNTLDLRVGVGRHDCCLRDVL